MLIAAKIYTKITKPSVWRLLPYMALGHLCGTINRPYIISDRGFDSSGVGVIICAFYPRDAMLVLVIAIATCLSVRLSRAGVVSKRRKLAA